jgi:hypothetical protein
VGQWQDSAPACRGPTPSTSSVSALMTKAEIDLETSVTRHLTCWRVCKPQNILLNL